METKNRKRLFNILMAAAAAVIVFCGIMAAGTLKGWFDSDEGPSSVESGKITGIANIERSGIGYSLDEDLQLQAGDIVETESSSAAVLEISSEGSAVLNEKTEAEVISAGREDAGIDLRQGELLVTGPGETPELAVAFGKNSLTAGDSIFSVYSGKGSSTVNVYRGKLTVRVEDGDEKEVREGMTLSAAHDSKGNISADVTKIKTEELSDFVIERLAEDAGDSGICYSRAELEKLSADRRADKKKAVQEAQAADAEIELTEEQVREHTSSAGEQARDSVKTCTIQINCGSILSNMDDLKPGKNAYVPSNGTILAASTVQFTEGQTVYDALRQACSSAGIPLDAVTSPVYGSVYVRGINNLYEFDCGQSSGWKYSVNGWYPGYGCSKYALKNGDSIVWTYTCR